MSDLDKAIRAELETNYWRASRANSIAADRGARAILSVLDLHTHSVIDRLGLDTKPLRQCAACGLVSRDQWCETVSAIADDLGVSGEDRSAPTPAPRPYPLELFPGCPCKACVPVDADPFSFAAQMHLCPKCGNKRCPGAANHNRTCTGSNEPGQPGSLYERPAPNPARCTGCSSADEFWCSCPDGYTPPAEVVSPEGTP